MNLKLFEVRDAGTLIPIFAFRCRPVLLGSQMLGSQTGTQELSLLARAGFDRNGASDCIVIGKLNCGDPAHSACTYDPYAHPNRTLRTAHLYIESHWEELKSGDVVDVEFVFGLTKEPKQSESLTN